MDRVAQLYYSRMRLYRDRPDVLTPGRWYWCHPGAKVIPYSSTFVSHNWDWEGMRNEYPLGESQYFGGYAPPIFQPRMTGKNWCGGPDVWLNGALYSQRGTPEVDWQGVPYCCQSAPEDPGGGVCNGTALFETVFSGAGLEVGGGTVEPSSASGGGVTVGGGTAEIAGSTGGGVEVGGGIVDPDEFTGAGVEVGGGIVEPSSTSGGGVTVGGAVDERYVGGGVTTGGGITDPNPDEFTGAGVEVGGGIVEPDEFTGAGVEVGGGIVEPEPDQVGGGVEVGGAVDEHYVGGGVEVGGGAIEGPVYMGCPECPGGTWPRWLMTISGGTGDFAVFNGMILSDLPSGCLWRLLDVANNIDGQFVFFLGNATIGIFQTVAPFAAVDYIAATDCIGPITLALFNSTGFGTPAATATVTGQ